MKNSRRSFIKKLGFGSTALTIGRTGKGVDPFQYAHDEKDSFWRKTNAGGIAHSNIKYEVDSDNDVRFSNEISSVNYFENFK